MITNILNYLENSAQLYPDKIAFQDEESACTYSQLVADARKIGAVLSKYTSPRRPIPVFMEKGVEAIKLFMGIVYSGCFYVMMDVKQPEHRLKSILDTLEPDVLVTTKEFREQAEQIPFQKTKLLLEDLYEEQADESILFSIRNQAADIDPLYGIFTSGSTGIPKGVVVSHRSVIDFMECFTDIFGITKEDVIGNQAPFDFDVSVKDIYSTLKMGATMQIIPRKMFSVPMQLMDYLCDREVTTLIWAVSALCIITTLKGFSYKIPSKIRKVMFSGEVMPIKHLNIWRETYPDAMFVNLYGPTEITCNCTYYILDRPFEKGEVLPMGKAFPNEKVFLLDEENKLITQANQSGELCVSGTALALGYYRNSEQTNKAFVQNPLNDRYPEIIYRTGDLAYLNEEGQYCFASRKDFQIKHMGHRIELGEIEIAMEKIDEIVRVCCLFDEKKNKILAFYEGEIEKREIVQKLGEQIPAFMIPNVFYQLEHLPITKNGKIDRNALKMIQQESINRRKK